MGRFNSLILAASIAVVSQAGHAANGVCERLDTCAILDVSDTTLSSFSERLVLYPGGSNVERVDLGGAYSEFDVIERPTLSAIAPAGYDSSGFFRYYVRASGGTPGDTIWAKVSGTILVNIDSFAADSSSTGQLTTTARGVVMVGLPGELDGPTNPIWVDGRAAITRTTNPSHSIVSGVGFGLGGPSSGAHAFASTDLGQFSYDALVPGETITVNTDGASTLHVSFDVYYGAPVAGDGTALLLVQMQADGGPDSTSIVGGVSTSFTDTYVSIDPAYLLTHPGARVETVAGIANSPPPIDEPSTLAFMCAGLLALPSLIRRRRVQATGA